MNYIFVFTTGILIINMFKIIGILTKRNITFPHYYWLDPCSWWIVYPSLFFQIYWYFIYKN